MVAPEALSTATPAALSLARVARGLTQAELSKRCGVSQAYLSKAEKGSVALSGVRLAQVADALDYPVSFFVFDPAATPTPTACMFPRKRNSLPTSVEKRVRALLTITRMQVEPLLDGVAPPVTLPRRAVEDRDWVSAVEMATEVRQHVGNPSGPIGNLTSVQEQLGVVVIIRDLGSRRLDAIGQWPSGHRPMMLINSTAPADRRRFTAAHELGHAVLHSAPDVNQEAEADQFAAELLVPAHDGHSIFKGDVDLPRLAGLKADWGVSMAALARRAWDLGRISDYRYRQLNIELSAAGYRTSEPVALGPEAPRVMQDAIKRRQAAGTAIEEMASQARLNVLEFSSLYLEAAS